jgi:hypothetical protein
MCLYYYVYYVVYVILKTSILPTHNDIAMNFQVRRLQRHVEVFAILM